MNTREQKEFQAMTALKVRGQLTVKGVWGGEMMWFDHLL
jgi:hypothetical protein